MAHNISFAVNLDSTFPWTSLKNQCKGSRLNGTSHAFFTQSFNSCQSRRQSFQVISQRRDRSNPMLELLNSTKAKNCRNSRNIDLRPVVERLEETHK